VNNLAEETTWQALKDYFKQAGTVAHADVLTVSTASGQTPSARLNTLDTDDNVVLFLLL